jgi:hypothetical protein
MMSRRNIKKNNITLKHKINKQIFKNGDICCESNVKRPIIVDLIFNNYMDVDKIRGSYKDEYLDWIHNDLLFFIGPTVDLMKNNDKYGLYLSKLLEKMTLKNNKTDRELIAKLLMELPLYYLLAFLGYSNYYKYDAEKSYNNFNKNINKNNNKFFNFF